MATVPVFWCSSPGYKRQRYPFPEVELIKEEPKSTDGGHLTEMNLPEHRAMSSRFISSVGEMISKRPFVELTDRHFVCPSQLQFSPFCTDTIEVAVTAVCAACMYAAWVCQCNHVFEQVPTWQCSFLVTKRSSRTPPDQP